MRTPSTHNQRFLFLLRTTFSAFFSSSHSNSEKGRERKGKRKKIRRVQWESVSFSGKQLPNKLSEKETSSLTKRSRKREKKRKGETLQEKKTKTSKSIAQTKKNVFLVDIWTHTNNILFSFARKVQYIFLLLVQTTRLMLYFFVHTYKK